MTTIPSVLLVGSEGPTLGDLGIALASEGFLVSLAGPGRDALQRCDGLQPDLVLVDAIASGESIELCRQLRARSAVPIIVMDESDLDVIVSLDTGADDYVRKPYRLGELAARMRAVLRRAPQRTNPVGGTPIRIGDVTLDPARHEVTVGDRPVAMPLKEFQLLQLLMEHGGMVVTQERIIERVWGSSYHGDFKTVHVHVKRVRRRLEDDAGHPKRITTIRGLGYRFEASERMVRG